MVKWMVDSQVSQKKRECSPNPADYFRELTKFTIDLTIKGEDPFINSTLGRLQIMRAPGKTLNFPSYSVERTQQIRIPNIKPKFAIF